MKSVSIAALAALLSTGALAVPTHNAHGHGHGLAHANLHRKRDIVWETEYEIETVTIIKTVYGNGVEATGGAYAPSYVTASATTTSAAHVAPTTTKSTTAAAQTTATTTTTPAAVTTTTTPAYVAPTTEAAATTTTTTTTPATTEYVAPSTTLVTRTAAPTTTADVPTTTAEAPTTTTTTTTAPATTTAASSSGSGSYSGNGSCESGASYTGDVTYYDPGLGACGITNVATDSIIAVSHVLFDAQPDGGNPNNNPLCGRTVTITAVDGSTHTATVTDRCVGCAEADIDLTQSLFNTVTSNGDGRVHNMKWTWE